MTTVQGGAKRAHNILLKILTMVRFDSKNHMRDTDPSEIPPEESSHLLWGVFESTAPPCRQDESVKVLRCQMLYCAYYSPFKAS